MDDVPTRVWWQDFSGYGTARPGGAKPLREYKDFKNAADAVRFRNDMKLQWPDAVFTVMPVARSPSAPAVRKVKK